ncbi:MAG: hypothetical protein KBG28_10935 [Kofleriaceae bacterium]|nr:hypothetical protein [Kofleriaceae bacterium]MBP6839657.1 hypothetical protein [Kofleriaceae bacterium]MBP9204472.1 hypothetical protein [Kofleriaceae bacterium]
MANVKGSALASRILWVSLGHGQDGLRRLAAAASPALRALVERKVEPAAWYPFDLFIELMALIDREFGRGDGRMARVLGYEGAGANLPTIYRLFYRIGAPLWILGRAAKLWSAHYDSGRLVVRAPAPRQAELDIVGFEQPTCSHCEAVAGWTHRALELSGGKDAAVDVVSCRCKGGAVCRLRATWR